MQRRTPRAGGRRLALRLGVAQAIAIGALACAGSASATVTTSAITTPSGTTFGANDTRLASSDPGRQLTVLGTSNGTIGDAVDLRCFYSTYDGSVSRFTVATNVPVAADGSFHYQPGDAYYTPGFGLSALGGSQTCRLRAVPHTGYVNGQLPSFAGPIVSDGYYSQNTQAVSGSMTPVQSDFDLEAPQLMGASEDIYSVGNGGLYSYQYVNQLSFAKARYQTWDAAAALYASADGNPSASGRSEILVGGKPTYDASSAIKQDYGSGPVEPAGYAGLTSGFSRNPANGDTTVADNEVLQQCNTDVYPPTAASCATLVNSGVKLNRTIQQSNNGQTFTVTDNYSSTDGSSHPLDVEYDNNVNTNDYPLWTFPGEQGEAIYASGDTPSLGSKAPASISFRDDSYPDGSPQTSGPGALTFAQLPNQARFSGNNSAGYEFVLQYIRTVPASGNLSLVHVYNSARTTAAVLAAAHSAEASLTPPTPAGPVPTPTTPATPTTPQVIAPTTTTTLVPAKVVCHVPSLRYRSLASAKARLRAAHCALGHVTRRRGGRVVVSQGHRAGATLTAGSSVRVTLGKKPKAKHKAKHKKKKK